MFLTLSLLSVTVFCLTACSLLGYYKTYSGQVKQLDFTFEYPREWEIAIVGRYPELVYLDIWGPDTSQTESPVKVSFTVFLMLDSPPEQWAQDKLNREISSYSGARNFHLVIQETTSLDGYNGYWLEYTYDHPASDAPDRFYIPTRTLVIIVPRGDVVYEIGISASQNEWNTHEQDIQHVLDTFRWK